MLTPVLEPLAIEYVTVPLLSEKTTAVNCAVSPSSIVSGPDRYMASGALTYSSFAGSNTSAPNTAVTVSISSCEVVVSLTLPFSVRSIPFVLAVQNFKNVSGSTSFHAMWSTYNVHLLSSVVLLSNHERGKFMLSLNFGQLMMLRE